MQSFIYPVKTALFIFPVLAFLFTMPYTIYQYRKYGVIPLFRTFVIFSFLYYMMNAYFMVILPLPARESVHTTYREMMQLVPFQFITDIRNEAGLVLSNPSTYISALKQPVVTQVLFNIILTIPFGVYLRYFFKRSLLQTFMMSFALALFFELSQLSGLFFIYPGPYRLFDVDDLMLNTFGGIIGYAIAPLFMSVLPNQDKMLERHQAYTNHVTIWKRFTGFVVDLIVINVLVMLVTIGLYAIERPINEAVLQGIVFVLYFVLVPYLTKGYTVGSKILKTRFNSHELSFKVFRYLWRALLVFFVLYSPGIIVNVLTESLLFFEEPMIIMGGGAVIAGIILFGMIYWIQLLIRRPYVLFFEKMSGVTLDSNYHK
ncbi:VanZ family protein [Erysipelothrix anatis]|uniref:VanZ family protein n=1 Tax=Erysipelothrix anatis TaxID=2683713 RepID=UPI00135C95D4|nr:VanZ family protein [Erysipelothrix anatis]